MKKLSDYKGQKIAVNCTTPEQAKAFCKLMHENGLKWISGDSYLERINWEIHEENTCYDFNKSEYTHMHLYEQKGYTILPSTDFLEEEFVYGQEYEFSDDEEYWVKTKFIAKSPCGNFFIVWINEAVTYYVYARKINTERTEAITTAKELITKFDIKQEELFNN